MQRASILAISIVLAACSSDHPPADAGCPATRPADGEACSAALASCNYDDGNPYSGSCVCVDGWRCSSCAADFPTQTSCTPGASCTVAYAEDDCSCGCDSTGHWHCSSTEGVIQCPFPP